MTGAGQFITQKTGDDQIELAMNTEKMFSIAGVGSLIVDRINYKDEPVIIAGTILIAIVFTVIMLIVDVAYAFIDPRIKAQYSK